MVGTSPTENNRRGPKLANGDLVGALIERRVLTVGAGDNQVRLLPPLTVTEDEIDEAIDAIDSACSGLGS